MLREKLYDLKAATQTGRINGETTRETIDAELPNGNRYIGFNRKAEVSRMVEASLSRRNIKVDPIMELDTLETFQMMIMRGLGVGILPRSSIREHFKDAFYTLPFGSPALQRRLSLVQRRTHHRQMFLDTLYDALNRVAGGFRSGEEGKSEVKL